jgi:tetratricopeptide (TPR) repeat protein
MTPACAAQYVIDGLTLGTKVTGPNLQFYGCKPSDEFAQLTLCNRGQAGGRGSSALSTVMHKDDGTAVYLMVKIATTSLTKKSVQNEIDDLSRELGGLPVKVEWHDQDPEQPTSLVARWGAIKWEPIDDASGDAIEKGTFPGIGLLVDTLGDVRRSVKAVRPVYRIIGGTGYVYSASFDKNGRGHRQYIAANGDELAVRQYEIALTTVLRKDKALAAHDFHLWSDVADITRRLSRGTSPKLANAALDKVFDGFQSKKLRSHVWAFLPGGAIEHLSLRQHWSLDIYGPNTEHPTIRRDIERFLADKPSDPFVELLYYVIGEYDEALKVNPRSLFSDVLHYASGFDKLRSLLHDTIGTLQSRTRKDLKEPDDVSSKIVFLIENKALFDGRPLSAVIPKFTERAALARSHFEAVLRDATSPHADDAAFMLGWLTLQEGKTKEALSYFSKAMVVGNGDYKEPGAIRRILRVLEPLSYSDQLSIIDADPVFTREPALAYAAARSAYREYNYAVTIEAATRYLNAMNVPSEQLPATTDPKRIREALEKVNSNLQGDANLEEIPYLLQASKELSQYERFLQTASTQEPGDVYKEARTVIIKYSTVLDESDDQGVRARRPGVPEFAHEDPRQAIHLIDMTLANTPKTASYARLREWLYYRKVRVAVRFTPRTIPQIIAAMKAEFPASQWLDDVLAEELYAEGLVIRDLNAARRTFREIVENYPKGNAVDNAYSWMAIILRCEKQYDEAAQINREIIRRFPLSRHARYAKERLANPKDCGVPAFFRASD